MAVTLAGRDPATGEGIAVTMAEGRIAAVAPCAEAPAAWLSRGFTDLQVNGFAGIDLNSGAVTAAEVEALAGVMARHGVARWLPTIVTGPEAAMLAAMRAVDAACRAGGLAARTIAGLHVEGPFISPADGPRGAHPLDVVRPATAAELARWREASGDRIRILTLAPEAEGALALIPEAVRAGIKVAIGHSAATPEQVEAAVAAGATLSTHLGNGCAGVMPRHPNLIWSQLAEDRLTAGFIADGEHLPPAVFRAMLRAKGEGRAFLVSDAVALGGMPPGRYSQPIGGDVEVSASGRISVAGTPYLAGASQPLPVTVARAADMAGLPLPRALALATEAPARIIGEEAALVPGAPADLIRFDWQPGADHLALRDVWLGGERVGP